jgi:hypothetical protein
MVEESLGGNAIAYFIMFIAWSWPFWAFLLGVKMVCGIIKSAIRDP